MSRVIALFAILVFVLCGCGVHAHVNSITRNRDPRIDRKSGRWPFSGANGNARNEVDQLIKHLSRGRRRGYKIPTKSDYMRHWEKIGEA